MAAFSAESLSLCAFAPAVLEQPMYYLSPGQASVVETSEILKEAVEAAGGLQDRADGKLGCYVPHRKVAAALGLSSSGIDKAEVAFGAYLWCTEFENVHSTWVFEEPGLDFNGLRFKGPEQLFQLHKFGDRNSEAFKDKAPAFAEATPEQAFRMGRGATLPPDWESMKESVMRDVLRAKFEHDGLRQLLKSTHPHPLVSVKSDAYWGAGFDGKGRNRLGALLQELRDELLH
ncbi:ybiA [Symbiodinium necroappetens]|uniref:YbiA protein n=1 Tax=Symbiodinium necroappetens TaxID=1628268 RepID=A0A812KUS5_9DINO|nr:ybiA [Symbiodinium necroappetens]